MIDNISSPTGAKSKASRLYAAISSTMSLAGTFTDILIHEGQPIRLKSAQGIIDIRDIKLPGSDLIVDHADIKHFFANFGNFMDGDDDTRVRSGSYWETQILPALAQKQAVNRSMPTRGKQYLRFSLFHHSRGKLAMIVRVTTPPPELESIGLTKQILDRIKTNPRGLLIITGPTASGKTQTALSILEWLNNNRPGHIVTVEDPIEYPMEAKKCIFTQREVGMDVPSFGEGLRDAMRHSPDAILAGEVRDRDTAEAAVLGGESGALMIVTTHGRSVTGTIRKILTLTGEQSPAMREVMAGSLMGVIRQELVPRSDRSGYAMVCDTLHMTDSVRGFVERGDWSALDKLTNNDAMPSPDFVPMSNKLKALSEENVIKPDVIKQMIHASSLV